MRKIRFGGPALGPVGKTWFEARKWVEPDPERPGQTVEVGGQTEFATDGDLIVAEDMGVILTTGEPWADYHVRTGRASWVEDENSGEPPAGPATSGQEE